MTKTMFAQPAGVEAPRTTHSRLVPAAGPRART